jgi:hypothetical protein
MKLQFNESGVSAAFAELQEQNKELSERCSVFALKCARLQEAIAGYKARVEELTADPSKTHASETAA